MPIVWSVLFAVLFNIALPALAASRVSKSPVMAEICTSSGMKNAAQPGTMQAPGNHANLLHDGHCQLCPIGMAANPVPDTAIVLPIALQPLPAWSPASSAPVSQRNNCCPPPSHAPPVFS